MELEAVPIFDFRGFSSLKRHIDLRAEELKAGRSREHSQFVICRGVSYDQFMVLDRESSRVAKGHRLSHYEDGDLLVVKIMPSGAHETAHLEFWAQCSYKLFSMGCQKELKHKGATTYTSVDLRSRKQADSSLKPVKRGGADDWPTIVFESGVSESLRRLRVDAKWWLMNSGGEVNIVILISINKAENKIAVEKWCLAMPALPLPATRSANNSQMTPNCVQEIAVAEHSPHITPAANATTVRLDNGRLYSISGAPAVLELEKLLERAPTASETDIFLSADELARWADGVLYE